MYTGVLFGAEAHRKHVKHVYWPLLVIFNVNREVKKKNTPHALCSCIKFPTLSFILPFEKLLKCFCVMLPYQPQFCAVNANQCTVFVCDTKNIQNHASFLTLQITDFFFSGRAQLGIFCKTEPLTFYYFLHVQTRRPMDANLKREIQFQIVQY